MLEAENVKLIKIYCDFVHFNIKYFCNSIMSDICCSTNKMKTQKCNRVGTIFKSYKKIKIIERSKIDTSTTKIHVHSLSWVDTGTSIKSC